VKIFECFALTSLNKIQPHSHQEGKYQISDRYSRTHLLPRTILYFLSFAYSFKLLLGLDT